MEPEPGQQICAPSIDFAPTISGTVFVAGQGTVYKTTDGGDTWDRLGPELSVNDIALHPTDPDTAYIGEGYYGVYRTTDGGTTWEVTNQGLTAIYPRQLQVGPDRPDIVYALVGTGDVYRGVQGGEAWHRLPISRVDSILIDPITPTRVYAGMDYNDPYVGISDDRGQTWSASAFLQPPTQYAGYAHFIVSLLAIPGHPGTLLAGCAHISSSPEDAPGSIYRTTDYGEHWDQVIPTGTQEINEVVAMTFDPMTPTIIYAAARASGMLRSTDGGQTWQSTGESVAAMDVVKSIAVETVPPYRVYAMTAYPYGELYYSEDHGLSWTQATSPIGPQNVLHILWTGPAPRLLYSASLRGLSRSMDGGQSWQRAAGALGYVPVYALASVTTTDRMILYAGTTGGEVGEAGARMLGGQNDDVPLLNAGVYRYTTRRLGVQVFLPLVLRAYAQ